MQCEREYSKGARKLMLLCYFEPPVRLLRDLLELLISGADEIIYVALRHTFQYVQGEHTVPGQDTVDSYLDRTGDALQASRATIPQIRKARRAALEALSTAKGLAQTLGQALR